MLAALPNWVDYAARDLGIIAGLVVAIGVIVTKTPLGRILAWLYRRLFGQPVTQWLGQTVHGVIDPIIRDLSDRNDRQHAESAERLDHIETRVGEVELSVRALQQTVDALIPSQPTEETHP